MSIEQPIHRFRFHRPPEVWRDGWVEHAVGRVYYRIGMENGFALLARLMLSVGQPEGDIGVTEVRGRLTQYLESLTRLAACETPIMVSQSVYQALTLLSKDGEAWVKIECKPDLLARNFVVADDTSAMLTDAGTDALANYGKPMIKKPEIKEEKPDLPITITAAAYTGLRYVQMEHWSAVHTLTKKALLKREYVETADDIAIVTTAGETVMAEYEAVHGRPNVSAPAKIDRPVQVPKEPKEPRQKKITLSDTQAAAFEIAIKQPYKWFTVATRTASFMTGSEWIVLRDDMPKVTETGLRVYREWVASRTDAGYTAETQKAA